MLKPPSGSVPRSVPKSVNEQQRNRRGLSDHGAGRRAMRRKTIAVYASSSSVYGRQQCVS
jgi:hypothetical protein